ncbi:MAG: nitronate monooxygenase [Verrucomicrobia bacterium]|nr:nitronate monooxygenase [Verrucomicrobiota bacterium]MBU4290206.1 nitronate monooxygenase [Verrucomicrobiota bacterium]MBU4496712.1 nitronate monooxygenase [Verrucomicrobiota bacterium]MCG2680222.1 nitronate monooxygenase [Kiritimatiellia bacterium]
MNTPLDLPQLIIGDLTVPLPIIQGGMGVAISMAGLAAAVANEGGVGVIATPGIALNEPDLETNFWEANLRALRTEIRKARANTRGLIGVNIMVALTNFEQLARTAMEEKIDFVFSGAGLPMNLPAYRPEGSRTKLVPIVSSGRAAAIIARRWKERFDYLPDAFVVEGPLAGGHIGFKLEQIDDPAYAVEKLTCDVLDVARGLEQKYQRRLPVIPAGGIYTGADIRRFLDMGAAGAQMATRFVTTVECDAAAAFKQAYIDARESDLVIIKSPVGMPGRAIRNKFLDEVLKGQKIPYTCSYHCIITCDMKNSQYCIAHALVSASCGQLDDGFAFAGSNAWRATKIITVKQLFEDLREEYRRSAPS